MDGIGWNPDIAPRYAMVDFDSTEIMSLEAVFPEIAIYFCVIFTENKLGIGASNYFKKYILEVF